MLKISGCLVEIIDQANAVASPNRAYLATVLRTFAQIHLQGTSDTLETLGDISMNT